jgi:hypothetical protein
MPEPAIVHVKLECMFKLAKPVQRWTQVALIGTKP